VLVYPSKERLILPPLPNSAEVFHFIPGTLPFEYKGHTLTVVPHTLEATKVLRNLGIDAPSPIGYYYGWPQLKGIYPPFDHQRETSAFLTLHRRAYVLNEIGCVDSETEYLSPTGWRRMDQYDGGKVAQYNLDGTTEFVQPETYVKKPCETMIRFKTQYGIDQLLSPEHRVLYVASTGTTMVTSAQQVYDRYQESARGWSGQFITTFTPKLETSIPLTEAQLRVQVALMADGHFSKNSKTNRCVIRLKRQRKIARLYRLLNNAEINFKARTDHSETGDGFQVFTFDAPWKTKVYDERFWGASLEQLRIIADEVQHWDGSFRKSGGNSFFSTVKESADFIQYAYAATGRTAALNYVKREGSESTDYTVTARKDAALLYLKGWGAEGKCNNVWYEPSTDGHKYCFMVPSSFLIFRRNGCVFASGNTGKTQSALWAADYLVSIGAIRKVVIISPLSTLERVWGDAIMETFPHRSYNILHGTAERRKKKFAEDKDFYIINHDGLEIVCNTLKDKKGNLQAVQFLRDDIDLVIIDELAVYRNNETRKWKVLKKLLTPDMWVWGMTGTPIPNAPTDAYAQCKLLTPDSVPQYFSSFRNMTMEQRGPYLWTARKEALDIVYEAMKPAIRFTRDACLDLPDCIYSDRDCELTEDQKRAFQEVLKHLYTEVQGGKINAANEGVKMMKLQQIVCGVAYDTTGETRLLDVKHRLSLLKDVIEEAGQKVIVFAPFTAVVDMLDAELSKHWTVGKVYGATPTGQRNNIFTAFQKTKDPHVLVADAGCMAHGLTLTEASTIIWFAPITSNDDYTQANGRITRPGQRNVQNIVHLAATAFERKMYKRLKDKTAMQGLLLEMVESGM
jgi:hypothetical protein